MIITTNPILEHTTPIIPQRQDSRLSQSIQKIQNIAKFLWNWTPFFIKKPIGFVWSVLINLVNLPKKLAALVLSVHSYFFKYTLPTPPTPIKTYSTNLGEKIDVPSDGNCFFHCMLLGLSELQPDRTDMPPAAQELRVNVIDWMKSEQNQNLINRELQRSLRDYEDAQKEKQSQESQDRVLALTLENKNEADLQTVALISPAPMDMQAYLEAMKQGSCFASSAEIAAITHMYQIKIKVFSQRDNHDINPDTCESFGDQYEPTISIVHHNGSHFQLLHPSQPQTSAC